MASEDERIVMHVISKREDYYALLSVSKTATEDEIKKAYKKLALKLHPDKNRHPKAEEAFKHVSTAHQTLSDKEKRRIYDRHGTEGVQRHESGGGGGGGGFGGGGGGPQFRQYHFGGGGFGGGDDLFEEIFSMFLDPRMAQRRQQQQYQQYARQQRAQQQHYQQQQQQQRARAGRGQQAGGMEFEMNGNPILAFAPLILFFIFAILLQSSSVFDTGAGGSNSRSGGSGGWAADRRTAQERNFRRSLFSLSKTPEHPHERVTTQLSDDLSDLQVPYFVNGQFEYTLSRYGQRLRNVELEVARSKKESLERRCQHDIKRGNHHTRSQACRDMERFRKVPSN